MTTMLTAADLPALIGRMRLMRVGPDLWRVTDAAGRAIGHVQAREQRGGRRFAARRFHLASRSFREVGEFWTPAEAVECLRVSR